MLYTNVQELLSFLKKHNLWTKKEMGQNFLVSPKSVRKIVEAADIQPSETVLEIGPGVGILTEALIQTNANIRTIELDRELIPILRQTFAGAKNLEIEWGNALKAKLPSEPYKMVANIPYYITSPLINHFLQPQTAEEKRPTRLVILMQKEVAEKICAGEGNHNVLSLQVQIFGKPRIAGEVNRRQFFPQPKVDSAILTIDTYPNPLVQDPQKLLKLAKHLFAQKRKTLVNCLHSQLHLSKEDAQKALTSANIDPGRRPQTLSIEEWNNLVEAL